MLLSLACSSLYAGGDDATPAPQTPAELRAAIATVMEEKNVPGIGVALVNADGPVWVGGMGLADIESGITADRKTLFRIGSTSKMFVALSVLKLVEEGKLSLDDKVRDLAPDVGFKNRWEKTDPVRVVHLLEHTTGWDDIHLPEYAHNDPAPVTLKQGLDFHPHSRESRWVPGSRMSYCNSGPPVAAYIVEKITGQDFEEYVHENFLAPMGMETMTYRLSDDVRQRGATLYSGADHPQDYWHIIMRPSGSINASATDMARMLALFVNRGAVDGQQLISKASLQRMETAASTPAAQAGQQVGYGLHNYSTAYEHWVFRAHNGGVNGGLTELAYLPEEQVGYVFMINSDNGGAFKEISDLFRAYGTRHLEGAEQETGEDSADGDPSIAGYYYPINPRQQISHFIDRLAGAQKLWFEEGRLLRKGLLSDEPSSYIPVNADLYKSVKTGLVSLSRVNDPLAGEVVHAGIRVFKPVNSVVLFAQLGIAVLWGLLIATNILFLPVWLIRKLRKKIPQYGAIRIRLWPLFSAISVLAFLGLVMAGFADPFGRLGAPTPVSVGILLATLAYAVFTLLGVQCAISSRHSDMNRAAYWHSTISTGANLLVLVYLLAFGVIGVMTWA